MNNETTIESRKSDQNNIPDLLNELLDDLENLKSSDPKLHKVYRVRLLNLLNPKN